MNKQKNNLKAKILKKLGQLAWLSMVVFVLSLIAGTTIHIFAAFTEPTAAPGASDQDFAENILGANNADNEYDSSSVAGNQDGSIIERLEHMNDSLFGYSQQKTRSGTTVEGRPVQPATTWLTPTPTRLT